MRTRTPEQAEAEYNWLSPAAVAPMIGVESEDQVRALIRSGELDAIDVSRGNQMPRLRVSPAAVRAYLGGKREVTMPVLPSQVTAAEGRVYVLETTEGPHRIKVGFTILLAQRLYALRTMSPVALRLAVVWKGTLGDESFLHGALSQYRLHGEWFDGAALPVARGLMESRGAEEAP